MKVIVILILMIKPYFCHKYCLFVSPFLQHLLFSVKCTLYKSPVLIHLRQCHGNLDK
ncbi:hypothetical protein M8C21_019140 [Ambrosia artemisiifolia]|uniref:Uncharacterized protein n=1 Tax=Ambrosia artemisiifolia TaxID=4212 RepID=A0AAD5D0D4_AMBAR|nr:hypothetical protein M8C21_019140 [Ambrosia artemisiifolia]